MGEDAHPKADGASGDGTPDAPETKEAERLGGQPVNLGRLTRLAALSHGLAEEVELPGKGEQESEGVVGDLVGAEVGEVGDHDAPASGGVDVDLVHPGAEARDQPARKGARP